MRSWLVGAIFLIGVAGCGGSPATPDQQRADLRSCYAQVQKDLRVCNAALENAQLSLGLFLEQKTDAVTAYGGASDAHDVCRPEGNNDLLHLGTGAVPDSLATLKISDAKDDLDVYWAPDAATAMDDLKKLYNNPNDIASAADFKKQAKEMDEMAADAQKLFSDAAAKLAVELKPLGLISLS